MAHKIQSFFRTAKNKRFTYDPWYYDPVREELEERESAIRRELNKDDVSLNRYSAGSGIKGSFKSAVPRKSTNTTFIRLIILAALTGGALYILLS